MSEWIVFGERLKWVLKERKISYKELAEKVGLSVPTICRYVQCQRVPKATELLKIANVLGVNCNYLLGVINDPYRDCLPHPEEPTVAENATVQDDLLETIDMAINATNTKDIYSLGMRNGFRYVRSVITGEKPEYESVDEPEKNPDWEDAVNIILGSGKEYKAILSILNKLEIRNDRRAYTMKVLKAEKNAIWRICIGNAPNKDKIRDILSLMDGDESV